MLGRTDLAWRRHAGKPPLPTLVTPNPRGLAVRRAGGVQWPRFLTSLYFVLRRFHAIALGGAGVGPPQSLAPDIAGSRIPIRAGGI